MTVLSNIPQNFSPLREQGKGWIKPVFSEYNNKAMTDLTPGQIRYREYLKSDDWRKKKQKKWGQLKYLNKKGCEICGRETSLQYHHVQYKELVDINNKDLIRLCDRCHEIAHKLIQAGALGIRPKDKNDSGHISRMTKIAIRFCFNLPPRTGPKAAAEMDRAGKLIFDESKIAIRKEKMDIRALNRIIREERRAKRKNPIKRKTVRILGYDGNYYHIKQN